MNATPMNINPATAAQTQSTAGKQQDAPAPDVPFSQVLSREIAQNRKSSSKQDTDTQAGPDAVPRSARPAKAGAEITTLATADETSMIDPLAFTVTDAMVTPAAPFAIPVTDASTIPEAVLAIPVTDASTTPATLLAIPVTDASTTPAALLAIPVADALTTSEAPLALPVADASTTPATVLALPINPDPLKPAPPRAEGVDAEQSPDLAADTLPFQDSRKGRTPLAAQAEQAADAARGIGKTDPALPPQASTTAATASAFSGQLAAARQADAIKTGEFLSDLMSNPAMRPAAHAPLETLQAPNEIASPKLSPAVGTPSWGQAVGEKIVWMATAAQQTATLTLNPPNMGPLQIVLNVSNEQATASFFSAQPEVRQALEAAFPKLREMMNEAGIQLGQATVSADTPRQNDTSNDRGQPAAPAFPGSDEAIASGLQAVPIPVQHSGRGLVDTFA